LGFWRRFFKNKEPEKQKTVIKLVNETGNGFFTWNGELYKSDIIRSAIRPTARAVGKLLPKHIREDIKGVKVNPDPYMRFLLEEPNPFMGGQIVLSLKTQTERPQTCSTGLTLKVLFGNSFREKTSLSLVQIVTAQNQG
jgi:hypothetical protein